MLGWIAVTISGIYEDAKAREKWLDSMPKENSDTIRAADRRKSREDLKHRRALEIAEAGRPRNFWGK